MVCAFLDHASLPAVVVFTELMRFSAVFTTIALATLLIAVPADAQSTIHWQPETAVLIQSSAAYGRMARLPDDTILCAYSRRGTIYARRSTDNGKAWQAETVGAEYAYGHATNAELLVLRSGTVLLLYNERPTDGKSPYAIAVCTSDDGGHTWRNHRRIYLAGAEFENGCWEPAAIELPSGEIQLFFANEAPYRSSAEQQITRLRSLDGGVTWLEPQAISFRPGHRDGMPVPLPLAGGKQIAVAIEDNGLEGHFKPAIVSISADVERGSLPVCADDSRRQSALADPLPSRVYAGAPYVVQLPSGETVLSVQSTEGRGVPHDHRNSRMVVYVGDRTAHHFTARSVPFQGLTDAPGLWNALFVKDADTITAISSTSINGVRGLWAIDGRISREL